MNPAKIITPVGKAPIMVEVSLEHITGMHMYRITYSGTLGYRHGHIFVSDMMHTLPSEISISTTQVGEFLTIVDRAGAVCEQIS